MISIHRTMSYLLSLEATSGASPAAMVPLGHRMIGFDGEAWRVNSELTVNPSMVEVSKVGVAWGLLREVLQIRSTASVRRMRSSSWVKEVDSCFAIVCREERAVEQEIGE